MLILLDTLQISNSKPTEICGFFLAYLYNLCYYIGVRIKQGDKKIMEKMFTVEELKGKKLITLEKLLLEHRNISIINFEEWENINNITTIQYYTNDDGQEIGYESSGFINNSRREYVISRLTN